MSRIFYGQAERNAAEDGRLLYDSGESRAQQVDFLSCCILGSNSSIGAADNYTAAASPKPKKTIADEAPQVKPIAEMWEIIKQGGYF